MQPKLGIIAGGGALPRRVIDHCRDVGREYFVLALQGQAKADAFDGDPHQWVRPGAAGLILNELRKAGAQELVMVGGMRKPPLAKLRPDLKGLQILTRIGFAYFKGDNDLLRSLTNELEREGFNVIGVDSLIEDLLAPTGILGNISPSPQAEKDIVIGKIAALDLGARDIGQGVIVKNEKVIAEEDKNGTADLIRRSAALSDAEHKGVLVKMKKPGQERRADLPTIGVDTVRQIKEAGLEGIALDAGNALIIDREDVIAEADEAGIFIIGVENERQNSHQDVPLVYVIAGEPSGDRLGARLIASLKEKTEGRIRFAGVGGAEMAKEGLESLFPMAELSLMGLTEILPHLPRLLRRIKETSHDIFVRKPAVVVTIDSPGFTHRLAERLQGKNIPLVHYVAPSVWAWKPGRAKKVARIFDHLLTLLPFEPRYFEKEGLASTFVGHPVIESGADQGNGAGFRQRLEIKRDEKVLCVLPGSRQGEINRLLPVIKETLGLLDDKDLTILLPTVDVMKDQMAAAVKDWPQRVHLVTGEQEKFDAFAASNAALAASGTVALELALARLPSVTIYRFNFVTTVLVKFLVKTKYVNLINILLDKEVVPERLLGDCKAEKIAPVLNRLLVDNSSAQQQLASLEEALKLLGSNDYRPSMRAASVVLDLIEYNANLSE